MGNSDRSRRLANNSDSRATDDIPVAVRDARQAKSYAPVTTKKISLGSILLGGAIVVIGGAAWNFTNQNHSNNVEATNPTPTTPPSTQSPVAKNAKNNDGMADTVLGHFPYPEAPAAELTSIGGGLRLRTTAAKKYQAMLAAARSAGVNITTISAFRSVAEQNQLFFGVGAARAQQPSKRAEVSAPPKHSEHHTGYAVDVGDANVPATNLNQNFETTTAFKWLQANAARYGFELSFPKNNRQGVSYEPWHWRFVGDSDSLETFYKARNLK